MRFSGRVRIMFTFVIFSCQLKISNVIKSREKRTRVTLSGQSPDRTGSFHVIARSLRLESTGAELAASNARHAVTDSNLRKTLQLSNALTRVCRQAASGSAPESNAIAGFGGRPEVAREMRENI